MLLQRWPGSSTSLSTSGSTTITVGKAINQEITQAVGQLAQISGGDPTAFHDPAPLCLQARTVAAEPHPTAKHLVAGAVWKPA